MKKIILTLFCSCLCAMGLHAAEGITLGYCNGQWTRTGALSVDGETWVDAAVLLTTDMLEPYAGGQVTTLRVGLAARTNIDNVRAWVRTALDGENLAQGEISTDDESGIARGWNEIALSTPCPIASGQPLYIGFSYKQRAASSAISVVSGSQPGAFFLRPGDDAEWEDHSSEGLLSLEAVVQAENMAGYDLQLLSAEAHYNSLGEIEGTAVVHNNGSLPVGGYTLTFSVDGSDQTSTLHADQPLANGASATLAFSKPAWTEGIGREHALWLSISQLDGEAVDEHPENNTQRAVFSYPRTVLIEEFTGEACTNCPRAALFLHQALGEGDYASRTAMMAHHSGYEPDFLTFRPADLDYEWFFNHPIAVFAPALMFDRVAEENSYGTDTYLTPAQDPVSKNYITSALAYYLSRPSHAYIDLTAEVSGSTLSVSISGGRSLPPGGAESPTRLTVCLVEDHILQREQVSMDQYPEFEHMGALRAINSTWGDEVAWADDHFSASCQFTLSEEWVRQNLRVIAFLSRYTPGDPTQCEVENTAQVSLGDASGISTHSLTTHSSQVFDLQGRPASSLKRGVNIVRRTSNGTTSTLKIINHIN